MATGLGLKPLRHVFITRFILVFYGCTLLRLYKCLHYISFCLKLLDTICVFHFLFFPFILDFLCDARFLFEIERKKSKQVIKKAHKAISFFLRFFSTADWTFRLIFIMNNWVNWMYSHHLLKYINWTHYNSNNKKQQVKSIVFLFFCNVILSSLSVLIGERLSFFV